METRKFTIQPQLEVPKFVFDSILDLQNEAKKNGEKLNRNTIVVNALIAFFSRNNIEDKEDKKENTDSQANDIEETDDKNNKDDADKLKKMNDIGYLTIEQASKYLGINKSIIADARQNKEIDSKKVGHRFFYKSTDLDIWFEIYIETKGELTKKRYNEIKNKVQQNTNATK